MEPRKLIHHGYLKKSPPEHKIEKNYKWLKRYFRLWSDKTLEYYKDTKDVEPLKEPIDLRRCGRVCYDDEKYKKYGKKKWVWFFRLKTPERIYHFIAASKQEMDHWMAIINELCSDNSNFDIVDEVMNGLVPSARSNSTSSRSAWSTTSSSSNRSSPGMPRIHSPVSMFSQESASPRQRIMSIQPESSRIPTSPGKSRSNTVATPNQIACTPFGFIDEDDHGYDVLSVTSRLNGERAYDIPPDPVPSFNVSEDGVYNILPEPRPAITVQMSRGFDMKEPITVTIRSPMNSRKQNSTSIKTDNPGYVQMDPKPPDEYYAMKSKVGAEFPGPSPEKVFKGLPFMQKQKSKTLPQRPKHKEVVMDEIPNMKEKKRMEDIADDDAPKVNRGMKPPPKIDRAVKPSSTLPPRLSIEPPSSPTSEHTFIITTDTDDGMSVVHPYYNDVDKINALSNYSSPPPIPNSNHHLPRRFSEDSNYLNQRPIHIPRKHSEDSTYLNQRPNHISRKHSEDSTYLNKQPTHLPRKHSQDSNYLNEHPIHLPRKHSEDSTYLNQRAIVCDRDGQKLKVGETVHLSLAPPSPSSEQLPSCAYENSSPGRNSATSSVSGSSLYENDETFVDGPQTGYENFSPERTNRSLAYSEVETGHFTQHEGTGVYGEPTISSDAGDTGTHYVFVDTAKSNAVKLTLEQGRTEPSVFRTTLH